MTIQMTSNTPMVVSKVSFYPKSYDILHFNFVYSYFTFTENIKISRKKVVK